MPACTGGCQNSERVFAVETGEREETVEVHWCQAGRGCGLTSSLEQAEGCHQKKISPGVGRDLSNRAREI